MYHIRRVVADLRLFNCFAVWFFASKAAEPRGVAVIVIGVLMTDFT